ncbi:Fe-S cluster assembly protein SufD [Nafulsella turpanensis]|uniref:Fe-S cluster assembly protein SufD n=1 Tax=Nafulsella turpanensis TaxID=1265690 RepID=UPI000344F2CC|nr:Fe-S cluster assembly protein SufD [Nafulsella turpanensis]
MSTTTDIKSSFISQYREFEKSLNGSAKGPLHQLRKEAMGIFEETGFPHAKNEEYKYSNIGKALEKQLAGQAITQASSLDAAGVQPFLFDELEANQLVFINGQYRPELSSLISNNSEVVIKELSEAYQEQPELVANALSKEANPATDAFLALNTAFVQHGIFLHVPDKAVVSQPIVLHFISDSSRGTTTSQPRNLFLIGKSAQISVVEAFHSVGEQSSFTNIVTTIDVKENAQVDYFKLQTEQDNSLQVNTTQVQQEANSRFTATTITLGGGLVRNNLNIAQNASNIESNMFGLYFLHGKQHVDNHTVVDHRKPHCQSNELYKGIMDDASTGVFNGKIFVRQEAQKTNAFQSNKNILLSDNATINTKPQLEIWADDVKCSHGATTGQIDEEQVFYLRARGISEESARAMLLYAFAADIIDQISIEPLKARFLKFLSDKLQTQI